jgi:gluconolactonase
MKKYTMQSRSCIQVQKLLLILLSFGFLGLRAQDSIIPVGSTVKRLSAYQYNFTEGPVWFNDSVLLFVDDGLSGIGSDIYKYDPQAKHLSKWPTNSTHCTGLSCDKDGNLLGASFNILLINKAGQLIKTLASGYNGKPFDNPNDIIADDKGGVYFTDPDFFLTSPPQDKTAVYYIDSIGNVKRVIDDLAEPNGLVVSPDGTKLYVDEAITRGVYSWDIAPDGTVSGKVTLAELQNGADSYVDGMAIDIRGNIYVACDKGIQVFSAQGAAVATIVLPETPSNCDFGGNDFKTLYITARTNLYSIDLNYPGYAVSRNSLVHGIDSAPDKPLVEMYPNPAGDMLHIRYVNTAKINSIDVMNLDGKKEQVRMNNKETGIELNIQNLNPGMYLLRLISEEGMIMKKFVKE